MGLFSFLTGKSPEEMELAGDKFFKAEEFGAAKIEYEKAVNKAEKKFPEKDTLIRRLYEKIRDSREALALFHHQNSEQLMAGQNYSEARDLLQLALELTENEALSQKIKATLKKLRQETGFGGPDEENQFVAGSEPFSPDEENDADEEYFSILCNALPDDVRTAYRGYDHAFKQGFIALNNGDFETAVEKFTDSISDSGAEQPLVPLELATALVNLGQFDRAREMLEQFLEANDREVRAYQILCDIYWVTGNHDNALALIDRCPGPVKETFPVRILMGETCFQMGRYQDAQTLFQECEKKFGENEIISRSLAKTYEAMGNPEAARDIYARILNGCARCGVRTDPFIKSRYAELSFACGERTTRLLELYLSILQEDPDNKNNYYLRIYELYSALGNEKEAARFKAFMQ